MTDISAYYKVGKDFGWDFFIEDTVPHAYCAIYPHKLTFWL